MGSPEQEIGELLRQRKLKLAAVESATGGLISHRITGIGGSSDYYQGSITTYSNEIKMKLAGVKAETLEKYGAVSAQVAEEMAAGGRQALNADICIADTGIAGPSGATETKPVGLFYLGLSHESGTFSRKHVFTGNREQNKQSAAAAALAWLREFLLGLSIDQTALQERKVVTCFLESGGEILILRRSDRVGTYRGKWAGVSGYLEKDTTADEQVLTEIQEETGLSAEDVSLVRKSQPLLVDDTSLGVRWVIHPYLFHIADPHKIRLDWEHRESRWIKPEQLIGYETVPGLKEALERVI